MKMLSLMLASSLKWLLFFSLTILWRDSSCLALNLPTPASLVLPRESQNNNDALSVINLPTWSVRYNVPELRVRMTETSILQLTVDYIDGSWGSDFELHLLSENEEYAVVQLENENTSNDNNNNNNSNITLSYGVIRKQDLPYDDSTTWTGYFIVKGVFLGETELYMELRRPHMPPERAQQKLHVRVLRSEGGLDTAFKITLGAFVLVMYVNFGAVLDLPDLKRIVLRPIGPIIGMVGQFLIMPVLAFLIGYIVFPDQIELRLGLLFTGSGPAGGLSNIITVLLNGNINLSVTMTALSNLAAFGMMPLWVFTLGAVILEGGNFTIPYGTIATMSCSLLLPLFAGVLLQKYAPRVAKQLSKHLESASLILILAIMVFAFIVNSFLFKLFTWRILLACSSLPWLGYVLGWLMAKLCRQSPSDSLTIAIETGIQNTGIAIFMLKFAFEQPQADITSIVPVANSVLTPLPLLAIYVYRLCRGRFFPSSTGDHTTDDAAGTGDTTITPSTVDKIQTTLGTTTLTLNVKPIGVMMASETPRTTENGTNGRSLGHDNLAADV